MENWTEKADSALYKGYFVHGNNWHAIKVDPRFGPWLVDFSANDLRKKVKADLDMIQNDIPTGLNQDRMSGVNRSANDDAEKLENWKTNEAFALFMGVIKYGKNNWDAIKADPHFGPLLVNRDAYSCSLKYQHDLDKLESDILTKQQLAGQDTDVPEPVCARGAGGETSRGARARGKKGKGCRR